ncbi:MAG: hypothetical protein COA73_12125 [Candidatus Hydrogenedentota bacterium]|nr:MAG: hypothetical protein COA73_12125 [Candidatus Hydrogenedentota bacterium]
MNTQTVGKQSGETDTKVAQQASQGKVAVQQKATVSEKCSPETMLLYLKTLRKEHLEQNQYIERLAAQLSNYQNENDALGSLHGEITRLRELEYERELVFPIMNRLIGMSIRCEQMLKETTAEYKTQLENQNTYKATWCHHLMASREADLVDIQELMTQQGLEAFESIEDIYNSKSQHMTQRIETDQEGLHGVIAKRLSKGYMRYEKIIRKENVAVYFFSATCQ